MFFSDNYYVFGGPHLWPENRALLNAYNTRTVRETINRSIKERGKKQNISMQAWCHRNTADPSAKRR